MASDESKNKILEGRELVVLALLQQCFSRLRNKTVTGMDRLVACPSWIGRRRTCASTPGQAFCLGNGYKAPSLESLEPLCDHARMQSWGFDPLTCWTWLLVLPNQPTVIADDDDHASLPV
jgi:hypothetical protein